MRDGSFGVALDVTVDVRLASAGSRALAHVVDIVILQVVQLIVALGTFGVALGLGFAGGGSEALRWGIAITVVLLFLVQWSYFVLFERLWDGQTPGKRLLGLRVVGADGGAPGTVAILLRNLLRIVDFLPAGYGAGLAAIVLDSRSRRIGDLAAGTVVVADEPVELQERRWPEGLAAEEIRMVSAWFHRAPVLSPERREALARRLVDRLREAHPHLVREGDPIDVLHTAFPVA